jgi:hypothetical protein
MTGAHTRLASIARVSTPVAAPAAQTFPGPPSVEQLARRADVIVLGEVRTAVGEWDTARRNISTRVELTRAELLKGAAPSPVTFTQLGGRVSRETSVVAGAAEFRPGERVLVFLARRLGGSLEPADLLHGTFSIERDAATGREDAVRASGAPGAERLELGHVRTLVRRALGGQG